MTHYPRVSNNLSELPQFQESTEMKVSISLWRYPKSSSRHGPWLSIENHSDLVIPIEKKMPMIFLWICGHVYDFFQWL